MRAARFTPEAKKHLVEIWDYSERLWGERQADEYLRALEVAAAEAAAGRKHIRRCDEILPGLLAARTGSHILYMRLDVASDVLHVVGVLHERMDATRHLKGD